MSQYLYLTTIGWKSGKAHEIEIWYVAHAGCYYLCAEQRERAHWVQNLQRQPEIRFRVEDQTFDGLARIVTPDETDLLTILAGLMQQKYGWNHGLFVELCAR
ncbi:MAG: nitroreductase/quinone reductase family protein [Anaerolineae bacterium]|jgi:deazaflavin-dependent oxidoreductase (nitroreductase family)|nr:nitroreductase/quinone reductase family protein [Anaerolineae bacterium]